MSGTHAHGHRADRDADAGLHGHDRASGDALPAVPPPRSIATGVLEIDTMLGGWERVTAGYLIEGTAPVLIETGPSSSRTAYSPPRRFRTGYVLTTTANPNRPWFN